MKSNARGTLDLNVLEEAMREDVAALMLTVPNTLGIFEDQILEIARIVHAGSFVATVALPVPSVAKSAVNATSPNSQLTGLLGSGLGSRFTGRREGW